MTDKKTSGCDFRVHGLARRPRLRERIIDICEHLLVLLAFLVFLSFVQSVTATQQELGLGARIGDSAGPARDIDNRSGPRIYTRTDIAGYNHARS